ncbi:hypothetical protein DL96DRAFT_1717145 [Flagelloscypha sp. PMI_526]|nr:hypothetical protein DL96DRAFT_1717145 [Flagelloscypha sp. PMI_526]
MAYGPSPRIPIELFERVIFHTSDSKDLKRCCLVSNIFVPFAQAKLFYDIHLPEDSVNAFVKNMDCIISTPHIVCHIRSVQAYHDHFDLPKILDALEQGALRHLTLEGDEPWNWKSSLLRKLAVNVFPFLTSLTLISMGVPLSMIMSGRCLSRLTVLTTDLIREEGLEKSQWFNDKRGSYGYTTEYDQHPLFIKHLGLAWTRNMDGTIHPLVELIADGRFPALVSLNILYDYRRNFPIEDTNMLMQPLMGQLRCLDIGYWDVWSPRQGRSVNVQNLDPFQIGNYPQLLCFHFRLEKGPHREPPLGRMLQLTWLSQMCETLTKPHPLRAFILHATSFHTPKTGFPEEHASEGWDRFDKALQSTNLSNFSRLVLPIKPLWEQLKGPFRRSLPRINAAGKLTFQDLDASHFL